MTRTPSSSPLTHAGGVASGSRENMTGPHDGRDTDNRLHQVDAASRGEALEDAQRDRDSNGVAGGYDDSVETRRGDREGPDRLGITRGD